MNVLFKMLGSGLLKRDKKLKTQTEIETKSKRLRKKLSVEIFLRNVLGTRLLEKKF